MPATPSPAADPLRAANARYWRSNVALTLWLLGLWAFASLGCGVLLADWLNQFHLGGFPLGFWFAQQGSILCFLALVLVYALGMAHLDRRHRRELDRLQRDGGNTP